MIGDIRKVQVQINHPQKLVELYRKFYRAQNTYKPSTRGAIKPLYLAGQVIVNTDPSINGEVLVYAIAGRLMKLMQQCHSDTAQGYWVLSDQTIERQAILEFAEYLVYEVFEKTFNADRARLHGKQLGFLEDTCEFLYRMKP